MYLKFSAETLHNPGAVHALSTAANTTSDLSVVTWTRHATMFLILNLFDFTFGFIQSNGIRTVQ